MARLLIVEDETEVGETYAQALSSVGYAVRTCANGTAAIELFRRERADLVFCDLKLPGLDGLEVLEALKGIDPSATVILITAYGSVEVATHALRLGAYDFLEKPCTVSQIQQLAQRAMDYRRQLHQLTLLQGGKKPSGSLPSRLMEVEQMRADFFKLAVEELRNPLRLLSEALTLAQDGFYGPCDRLKQQFLSQCRRVQSMLTRTLSGAMALFLGHEQRVTAAPTDLGELLEGIAQENRGEGEERQVALEIHLPQEPLVGSTDAEKVASIIRELLHNALTFTPKGGRVELRLAPKGSEGFEIQVRDTGCGISEQKQKRLFIDRSHLPHGQRAERTNGLGLTLVRHYLDLLQGTITVESGAPRAEPVAPLPSPVGRNPERAHGWTCPERSRGRPGRELKDRPGQGSRFTVTVPWWGYKA